MTASQYDEWAGVAERFSVDMEQVRRDHLISHLLGAIAAGVPTDEVVFFGGTALSRTYLTDARLSEDIDLIALVTPVEDKRSLAQTLRHLVLATDAWLRGAILRVPQPFHEIGQTFTGAAEAGFDMSVSRADAPPYEERAEPDWRGNATRTIVAPCSPPRTS